MKVSVITPFYQGNAYMARYVFMLKENAKNLQSEDELEVLLVNDSPWEEIKLPGREAAEKLQGAADVGNLSIKMKNNRKNLGIHASRVNGLSEASGEWILFLDQDDELKADAVAKMLKAAREHPGSVVVANAVLEQEASRNIWYRSDYHKKKIGDLNTYLSVGTQIISPGQCLIPAKKIPSLWKERLCRKNGADDYYLWLLLLQRKVPFVLVDEPLYIHRFTARNLSADTKVTDDSAFEFLAYMEEAGAMPKKNIDRLRRMLRYKDAFRGGTVMTKLAQSLKNPDLFFANVIFKLRSKTPYGFNRG